jgi:hypothetical protein
MDEITTPQQSEAELLQARQRLQLLQLQASLTPDSVSTQSTPPDSATAATAAAAISSTVIDAVCSFERNSEVGDVRSMVGLPAGLCAAWSDLVDREDIKADCMHMFETANSADLDVTRATRCATALSSSLRMPANDILNCVAPTSAVGVAGRDACSLSLRSALILAGNQPIMAAMQDRGVVAAKGVTSQPEQIRRLKEIVEMRNPTTEHVTEMANLCRWDKGHPRDLEANTALAKMFMGMRPQDRQICNMSNNNCEAISSIGEMCNAVHNKIGTMAFMAKVDDFYDRGGFGGIGHQLARAAEVWPEPFNETFNDVLYACGINRAQADVVNALIDSSETAIVRNRDICDRIDRRGSILTPMTSSIAAMARV